MKLDEAQLYRAAKLADAIELAMLLDEDSLPKHEFSEQFEHDMELLIAKVKRNEIRPYKVFMGWQYYTKRGIAAILICFFLACATMPEAVIAGYHKLIEVIETIVTEVRTDYRYKSDVSADVILKPVKLGKMLNGIYLQYEHMDKHKYKIVYEGGNKYFILIQRLVVENDQFFLVVDSQEAYSEIKLLKGMPLYLLYKEETITYTWQYNQYHISGKTNLEIEELEEILRFIEI